MTAVEHTTMEPLGADESLALLMTAEIGRLAFSDGHGPTVEPFGFALEGPHVVIAVGTRSGARAAVGQSVAFQVDEIDLVHRTGWSVVAAGTLHGADPGTSARPESWPGGDDDRVLLVVRVERLSGRRLRREPRRPTPSPRP